MNHNPFLLCLAAGELMPSHPLQPPTAGLAAAAVAIPPPPPMGHGPPLAEAVLPTHHHMQATREEAGTVVAASALSLQPQIPPPSVGAGGTQTVVAGNFWDTVMVREKCVCVE